MKAFRRTRDGIRWRSSRNEVRLLRTLAEQLVEMVAPPEAADADDWMIVLENEFDTAPLDRGDPAVRRLFPAAYRDDEAADAEWRSLTEASMRRKKADEARVVLAALEGGGTEVTFGVEAAEAWLRTVNALRLVLGARLGIESADMAAAVEELGDAHPAYPAVEVYQGLGYVQGALLDCL